MTRDAEVQGWILIVLGVIMGVAACVPLVIGAFIALQDKFRSWRGKE